MSAKSRGFFLVLEGIDGSGTTTQAALLDERLKAEGRPCLLTREPTGGDVGRLLRQLLTQAPTESGAPSDELDPGAMALLFAADRLDHVAREIEPALGNGKIVISDRYILSSLLYQSETSPRGRALLPWLSEINAQARRPDLTIVLDVDADAAKKRRDARGTAEELYEKLELQHRLASGYRQAQALLRGQDVLILDGAGGIDQIHERLYRELMARL